MNDLESTMMICTKNEHAYSASDIKMSIEDALVLINKLTTAILHTQKHKCSSFSVSAILVVEDCAEEHPNYNDILNFSVVVDQS